MANGFSSYRLGIDIGGTFTDGVLVDEATGELSLVKVPSTPRDPSVGFMEAVKKILANRGIPPAAVRFAVHGTTVATNTIIEGKGARAAFLATQGFRDLLEIAFQTRPSLYDIFYDKPKPLIPRALCLGVPERIDADGVVQAPLDEAALRQAARQLKREGVEAIVVCFLHSYRNPAHERRAAEILAEECPGVALSISSEVCPEFREYVRASTTAVNAVLMPIVGQYVDRLQSRIVEAGMGSGLHLMTSGGGIIAGETARRSPVHLIESGPAAGVMAAAFWGEMTGRRQILALDIGGTTAKAALIQDGRPAVASEFEVGRAAVATTTRNKGQGYPVKTPVIDLVEIGAGGGSIGWVDPGGALAVGPQSAGADPGPAGYGRGGSEPTLTDANLILGRLNPDYFLGGEVKLDPGLARAALHERISARLAMDEVTAAHGMVEIANASMAGALHLITVQRGLDPRSFTLVAFGGAGPVHAVALARALGIPEIVIPMSPGVTSALGLLVTDLKHEYSRTYIQAMARVDWAHVNQVYREFEDRAAAVLRREGVAPDKVRFLRAMDMRFAGQSYELTIPVPGGTLGPDQIGEITQTFFAEHERAYGFAARSEPAEVVTLRLTAIGRVTRPRVRQVPAGDEDRGGARKGTRRVYFAEADGWIDAALYDRYALREGNRIAGPAIVEEMDSTTVIPPACVARVDRYGNLIIGGW